MNEISVGDAKTVTNKTFFVDLVQISEELSQTFAVISRSTFQLQQMVILRNESGRIYSRQARYELVLQLRDVQDKTVGHLVSSWDRTRT